MITSADVPKVNACLMVMLGTGNAYSYAGMFGVQREKTNQESILEYSNHLDTLVRLKMRDFMLDTLLKEM